MKLKKLLLPFASITSLSCIVAPTITSCGGNSQSFKATFYDDSTQNKYYEPKIEQKTGSVDQLKYEETYFADVQQNIKILIDDIFWYHFGDNEFEDDVINEDDEYETTTIKSASLTITDFAAMDKCMSGSLKTVIKKKTISTEDKKFLYNEESTHSYIFKDIPIKFYKKTDDYGTHYWFIFDEEKIENNDFWSIKHKSHIKEFGRDKDGKFISFEESENYLYDKEHPDHYLLEELTFASHYFDNIA